MENIKPYNLGIIITLLIFVTAKGCEQTPKRETIFDRVVNIPKELALDIPSLPSLCDKIPDLKKGFVDIEKGSLYYEQEGNGIPLVLLNPGPGGTHHCFHPYFSQLKDIARIIYYDMRGTGKSSVDETGKTYSIKQAVEDLESLRKALKIDRWIVLGWSFGGFLAQCYTLTYPEHVAGLILVAAQDGLTNVKMKPGREQMFISPEEQTAIKNIYFAKQEGKINLIQTLYNKDLCGDWKRQHYHKPTNEESIRAALYEWQPAPGFRELICPEINKISLDKKFDDFEIPTLIAEAKWDLTWDTDKAEIMHQNHPHAQFEYFEKSGHKIFADEPAKFFDILRKFLENTGQIKIKYKPGNRLTFPKPISEFACKIEVASSLPDKNESERRILSFYEQAVSESLKDDAAWEAFFNYFLSSQKHYEECLYALQQYEITAKQLNPEQLEKYGHCIKIWQAEMLNLLGRREEAIKYYQDILHNFKGICNYCSQVDIKWLEERLQQPFKLE